MSGHGWLHNLIMSKFINEFGKIFFPVGKVNFDPIANFVQTKEILTLGQVLNIQIDYFDVLPKLSRHAK